MGFYTLVISRGTAKSQVFKSELKYSCYSSILKLD